MLTQKKRAADEHGGTDKTVQVLSVFIRG